MHVAIIQRICFSWRHGLVTRVRSGKAVPGLCLRCKTRIASIALLPTNMTQGQFLSKWGAGDFWGSLLKRFVLFLSLQIRADRLTLACTDTHRLGPARAHARTLTHPRIHTHTSYLVSYLFLQLGRCVLACSLLFVLTINLYQMNKNVLLVNIKCIECINTSTVIILPNIT